MGGLEDFESVKKMVGELNLLTRSKNTYLTYLKALRRFVAQNNIQNLDSFIEDVKAGKVDANEVYKKFIVDLTSKNIAPKSVASWAAGIKKFFAANGIEVKRVLIKTYTIHEDLLPSKEDLKKILETSSLKAKVFILMLLSSGLRVGELHQLTLEDIALDKNPVVIRVKGVGAKERKSRITFISDQAKKYLLDYLEKRKSSENLTPASRLVVTSTGKPMSYQNLQYILNNAFKKVFKEIKGKRYPLHAHCLRKWFKTQMITAGVPSPIVDLAKEYELYTEDQLREWYMKGMKELIIPLQEQPTS
jgi:integrase/recombinase XerD